MFYADAKFLDEDKFLRLTGIKKQTFEKIIGILIEADKLKKMRGGRKSKLKIEDQLLLTLAYLREYRTYFHLSKTYGLSESTTYKIIKWVENTLMKHKDFALPGKKALLNKDVDVILIDATETHIDRPQKKQKKFYSGKKKKHTIKTQVVVTKSDKKVICTSFSTGKCHDFRLYKESKIKVHPDQDIIVDSGYQGLQKLHIKSQMPKKKTKKIPLSKEDKKRNKSLSSKRALNENVIGALKRFKIIACRYRNRRKRFALRFNLIAVLYNLNLAA